MEGADSTGQRKGRVSSNSGMRLGRKNILEMAFHTHDCMGVLH